MKKKLLNFVIIGSGPSSIGALIGLKEKNYAVITGESKQKNSNDVKNIHKKILFEEGNLYRDIIFNIFKNKKKMIYSISKIGGFGNYWGQGCEYVRFEKLNNKKVFKNKNEYLKIINTIYNFFKVSKSLEFININKVNFYPSPLLKNSPNKDNTNLLSFKLGFLHLVKKKNIQYINSRVLKIEDKNSYLILTLKNKKKIFTKKAFLSANTVGNSKIIFESDSTIKETAFYDDCPKKIYALSFNKKFNFFLKQHYLIIASKLNDFFISSYNMRKINLCFIFFYIFGIKINFLKKHKSSLLGMINFFQIWNKNTLIKGILSRDMTYCVKKRSHNLKIDHKALFNFNNIIPIKTSDTNFGEGFHYHNLKVKKNNKWIDIDNYLKKEYKNKVFCIDASSESKINPGSFTISQMAIASKKINSLILKFRK
jgi:hypothetical protein